MQLSTLLPLSAICLAYDITLVGASKMNGPEACQEAIAAGIDALAAFIKGIGLLTTFTELGIPADTDFRAITDSTNITAGCCKKLTRDEICEILQECL